MSNSCLSITPAIQGLTDKIIQKYPTASTRESFDANMCAEWIGAYNDANNKQPDYVPSLQSLINFIETKRNAEGKSFLYTAETVEYSPSGQRQQTYSIIGTRIFNKDGQEVFAATDENATQHRKAIFDKLAAQREREQAAQPVSVEQEMADIKAKAIADGTFMKAPNGKPTNLTERQWLQVRTQNFKRWFGDWEKLAPKLQVSDDKKLQNILQNIASSKSRFSTLAQFILDNHLSPRDLGELLIDKDFPLANQQGWYREIDDPQVGIIRYIGFQANNVPEETFNGAILHEIMHSLTQRLLKNYKKNPDSVPENVRSSIKKLYEIIDYSKKYILDNYNLKEGSDREKLLSLVKRQNFDKGYLHKMFYAFDETSNPESEHIDEFISEIFTNPAFQEILNSIPYKETKQTLWDKIKECIQNIFGIAINKGSVLEEALKASTEFITKAKEEYDSVSKVVDENGEPLVVYHGDHITDIQSWKEKFAGSMHGYFTASNKAAQRYKSKGKNYEGFLNIRHPYVWTEEDQEYRDVNKIYGDWSNVSRYTAADLVKLGYDGIYIPQYYNSYLAIETPNQIKSATDNNGEFSRENDSILANPWAQEIPVELENAMYEEDTRREAYDSLPSSDTALNEKFGNKTETTVSELLNNLLESDTPFADFIQTLKGSLGELGDIKVKLVPNSNSKVYGIAGLYSALDNTIYINRNATFKGKDGKVDNTILHELVHAIVANSLGTAKHREELGKIFEDAKEKILKKYGVESYDELPENLKTGRLYGLKNLDEFAAEFFTNSEFISELNDENTFGKRSEKKSIISRLVEWIKSLLPKGVTETYKRSGEILEDILLNSGGTIQSVDGRNLLEKGTINQKNNSLNKQIEYDDDFRRVQETSRRLVQEGKPTAYQRGDARIDEGTRSSLAATYARLLSQGNGAVLGQWISVTGKGNQFKVAQVTPNVFHDIFEINRNYLKNGELVDLHNDYSNTKCYLTEDGLAGFAIEENGNLVSVFSLNPESRGGFLYAIKDHAIDEGATHLDAYNSSKQPLRVIYEKVFGAKVASSMDYNMEYDHDDIAVNHGSPQVVFMVMGEAAKGKVEEKHFNKDQYDDAESYQHSFLPKQSAPQTQASAIDPRFKQGIETLAGYYEGGGALLTHDYPGVTKELDDKLADHFMEGKELSDDDYRELAKYISVVPDSSWSGGYVAVPKQQAQQQPSFDVSKAEFYSGRAEGSDIAWATEAKKLGIKVTEYTVGSYEVLPQTEKDKYNAEYLDVVHRLGRRELDANTYGGKLVRRDMMQADNADAIFAIGTIDSRGFVDGGTGYAATRGIQRGIPVYLYDRRDKQWKVWNSKTRKFEKTEEPTLTPHAAVVGTRGDIVGKDERGRDIRDISEEDKQVIRNILKKTVGEQTAQSPQQPSASSQQSKFEYARTVSGKPNYEVSSRGDSRFSAMTATFAPGTTLFGHDVSGRTIESVYQHGIKQGDWTTNNNSKTGAPKDKTIITGNTENDSYTQGYLPLWQEWARQNPQLIEELRQKARGKVLTDMFASTAVSQARALADILNQSTSSQSSSSAPSVEGADSSDAVNNRRKLSFSEEDMRAAREKTEQERARAAAEAEKAKNKPKRPKSDAYDSALNIKENRTTAFKRTFSPQQIKDRGAYISDLFSDILDEALEAACNKEVDIINNPDSTDAEKNEARQRLNSFRDPVLGRQKIMQNIGVPNMMNEIVKRIKESMSWDTNNNEGQKQQHYKNMLKFFEELFNGQAAIEIEEREGIRIAGLKVEEKNSTEQQNDDQDDGNDELGHIVSGNDGWVFEIRYSNPFSALSRKVRGMLYEIEKPESEKDDLGRTRNYPVGQLYASLLSYLSKNMQSPDDLVQVYKDIDELRESPYATGDMDDWTQEDLNEWYPNGYPVFPVLEKMSKIYPWVSQLIERLTEDYANPAGNSYSTRFPSTGGAMVSQLYTNFRKAFIRYGKIQKGTNPWTNEEYFGVTPLNYEMEDRVQYDLLVANYNNRMVLSDVSIYNSDGTVNKENAKRLSDMAHAILGKVKDFYEDSLFVYMDHDAKYPDDEPWAEKDVVNEYNEYIEKTQKVLRSFGIDTTAEGVTALVMMDDGAVIDGMLTDLITIADIISNVEDDKIKSFDYIQDTRDKSNSKLWAHFFDGRGIINDTSYMQSFYDSASKKTKYSYSADNYMMKTFRGVCMGTKEERRKYIDARFGKYDWYKDQNTGEWRNKWLEYWYNYEGDVTEIPYVNIDNITEYKGEESIVRPYTRWTKEDIWEVQDRSYGHAQRGDYYGYFLSPIFADSPMSMTLKGPKMSMEELVTGYFDKQGIRHRGAFVELVLQELGRIKLVQKRQEEIAKGNIEAIVNFDGKRGLEFCFIPELNTYTFENGEKFLDRIVRMGDEKRTAEEIEETIIEALGAVLPQKYTEYILENRDQYPETIDDDTNNALMLQYLNMTYANAAIIQMTTVDLAYYKNFDDFQKRFKEVYAGGIQLNTNSKYGYKYENTILLRDDKMTSHNYKDIAKIIDAQEHLSKDEKKAIKDVFKDINVADAQAIRAMFAFRGVLDMLGRWDDRMEEAYQNFINGTWSKADFDIIYQTIKPFAYAVIDRNDGFGGVIAVPQQHKNSEICALMMWGLISNDLKNSPVYVALSEFMEETKDANDERLIHMIQFESGGKVGNQGVININYNANKVIDAIRNGFPGIDEVFFTAKDKDSDKYLPNDEKSVGENYEALKKQLDDLLEDNKISQEQYNTAMNSLRPTKDEIKEVLAKEALRKDADGNTVINPEVVHTMPMDCYYQNTPTPEHHIDAKAVFGSQARNIITADLPKDFTLTVDGKFGKHTFKGRAALIDFFYELLNENLLEDFFGDGKDNKGLKGIFESKDSFREAVEEIVKGNPKYSSDFIDALQIDENTGNFVLSPNNPTMFNLMQEIVTSFFKNRITKQTIDGAALIQAAGIGLDDELRLRFDKDGKLLGAECYMPLTSQRFFEPLLEEKEINGEKVKVLDPKYLEEVENAVGYRIPTENKSSMMPLIIKGFTPLQNGSAIILPAEITAMAGSDFDVDKMFVMLLSFYIQNYDMKRARADFRRSSNAYDRAVNLLFASGFITEESMQNEEVEDMMDDDFGFKEWFEDNKEKYLLKRPKIKVIKYDFDKTPEENGRKARNNMIIQIMYGILTSKAGSESLFNPQGFPDVERAAKIRRIATDPALREAWNNAHGTKEVTPNVANIRKAFLDRMQKQLDQESYNELRQAVNRMTDEQVFEAYMRSVQDTSNREAMKALLEAETKDLIKFIDSHAVPESPIYPQTFAHLHARNMAGALQLGIYAIQSSMCAKYQRADIRQTAVQQFEINGKTASAVYVSENGRRVKNEGQMVGGAADNGKNPNLTDMGSEMDTAPIIGYMLGAGISHVDAALIISQPCMQRAKYKSTAWDVWKDETGKNSPLDVRATGVTTELLLKSVMYGGLTNEERAKIAALCYRICAQAEAIQYVTQVSRADSPNGAIENTYAKARVQRYKVDVLQAKMGQRNFPFFKIKETLSNNAVDTSAPKDVIRQQLKAQRMGFLHGMYALGINSFPTLMSPYFFGAREEFDRNIVRPILYNLPESMSDERKAEIVDNIYKSYITYILSGTRLFGNEPGEEGATMKEKRDFYLESFPDEYQKILAENKEIRDLLGNAITVITDRNGNKRIVLQNVGSKEKDQKNELKRRLDKLLYSDNNEAKKKAIDVAKDLLIYSYFDNGLQFTHDSFSTLFTTVFLTSFTEYNKALERLDNPLTEEENDNFIRQFLLTYPEAAYSIDGKISVDAAADTLTFDLKDRSIRKVLVNEVMSPNPMAEGENVYPYIKANGNIYILNQEKYELDSNIAEYERLDNYATSPKLPLFSIQMSVTEMAQTFNVQEYADKLQNTDSAPSVDIDGPYTHNDSNEDPSREKTMADAAAEMPEFEVPDFDDMMFAEMDEDNYQKEGESELQDPFCKTKPA